MNTTDFKSAIHTVVKGIPAGKVMTYSDVAATAGFPGASRAVGSLMRKNYDSSIPCHRVVKSDGLVGQYNREGGSCSKTERLQAEGVIFKDELQKRVDLSISRCV